MRYPKVYREAVTKLVRGIETPRLQTILAKYDADWRDEGVQYHARVVRAELERREVQS